MVAGYSNGVANATSNGQRIVDMRSESRRQQVLEEGLGVLGLG